MVMINDSDPHTVSCPNSDEMTLKEKKCPKCGYKPLSQDECPRCGITISKFLKTWNEERSGSLKQKQWSQKSGCMARFVKVLKWTFGALLILFIIGFAIAQYFAWWIDHTQKIHSTLLNYYSYIQISLFTGGDYDDETCCLEWLDDLRESEELDLMDIDQQFQDNLPPEDIRDLGFLFAKNIHIQEERKSPVIICQTPIETVRPEDGKPPGKNHLVLRADMRISWLTPYEYAAIDRSKYIDLDTFMQKYNQTKRKLE